jgi:hypothetical protein
MKGNGMSIVAGEIQSKLQQNSAAQTPPVPAQPAPAPQPAQVAAPSVTAESTDPLDFMKRLAGLIR